MDAMMLKERINDLKDKMRIMCVGYDRYVEGYGQALRCV